MKKDNVPSKGYQKIGEHDPFGYCHEIVDGDGDDYKGDSDKHKPGDNFEYSSDY